MDIKQVLEFIDNTPKEIRYQMLGRDRRQCSNYVVGSSVRTAIKNGHTDIDLWCWVQPVFPESRWDDAAGGYRTCYVANGQTSSWSLDLDNIPNVFSIDDLVMVMAARDMPLPYYVVHTSPNCFHCMYLGKTPTAWPIEKRRWLVEKWAGIDGGATDWDQRVRQSGVDLCVFNRSPSKQCMRVPGSINTGAVRDGTAWVCLGWRNPRYDDAGERFLRERGHQPRVEQIPLDNVSPISQIQLKPLFWAFREPIENLLDRFFPQGFETFTKDKLAALLSENAGRLARGECRIHQKTWGEFLGVPQMSVSRLLKRLIRYEILEKVDESYCVGSYSKTYRAGKELMPALGHRGMPVMQTHWVRWDEGTSHERLLADVRHFVSIGLDNDEIVRRLQERQAHRSHTKRRTVSELIGCVRRWRKIISRPMIARYTPSSLRIAG